MSKIERVDVFVASPGRTFVTLRVTTDDGAVIAEFRGHSRVIAGTWLPASETDTQSR